MRVTGEGMAECFGGDAWRRHLSHEDGQYGATRFETMNSSLIDLSPLRKALATLVEADRFWAEEPASSPLKPHLRSAVVQSFEFTYELSIRALRRVLVERSAAADLIADMSFNDLLRKAADAGLLADPAAWRAWREMRNTTSHAYDEVKAQAVASRAPGLAADARALLASLESSLGRA